MRALFDASVLVALVTDESGSEAAAKVWNAASTRLALDFTPIEVANALWSKCRRGQIEAQIARDSLLLLPFLVDEYLQASAHLAPALEYALRLNHPVYDCLYAAAAVDQEAALITADLQFAQKFRSEPKDILQIDASPSPRA